MKKRLWALLFGAAVSCVLGAVHAGNVTYIYTDHQGTTLAEADASGNITATFDYRPYGNLALGTSRNGPGFTGHVNDADTNLTYMQARYYDPVVGRFLSGDPKQSTPGNLFNFGRFAYANNSPTLNIDPDGRETGAAFHNDFIASGGKVSTYNSPDDIVGPSVMAAMSVMPVLGDGANIGMAVAQPNAVNIMAATVGLLPVIGGAAADAIKGSAAVERAAQIAKTMNPITQTKVTIAVTETAEGVRVVSSSEGALRSAARDALQAGEVEGKGASGVHAEINGINAAESMGLTPTGTAASRPICPSCAAAMETRGVAPLSPLKEK